MNSIGKTGGAAQQGDRAALGRDQRARKRETDPVAELVGALAGYWEFVGTIGDPATSLATSTSRWCSLTVTVATT